MFTQLSPSSHHHCPCRRYPGVLEVARRRTAPVERLIGTQHNRRVIGMQRNRHRKVEAPVVVVLSPRTITVHIVRPRRLLLAHLRDIQAGSDLD